MRKQTMPLLVALALAMSAVAPSSPAFAQGEPKLNQFWWPENLDLSPLRDHGVESDPMGEDFSYAQAFANLDLNAVKKDIESVLKNITGLVASGLRSLRAILHSHGLAQRGNIPGV